MVIWIIGLSGAGKSTLANQIVSDIRELGHKVILLDGDVIRALFGNDVDHSLGGRRVNAERLSSLTKFLADQEIHVVAAVLSIFPEWRSWNKENIPGYFEVYLQASLETLIQRDSKNLYARAINGEIKDVVGVDINFPEPAEPNLIINNDVEGANFAIYSKQVMSSVEVKKALKES